MIFRKDRATGDTAEQWQNVTEQEPYIPDPPEDATPIAEGENESVNDGNRDGETSSSMRRCKRKRGDAVVTPNPQMVNLMNTFLTDFNSQIGALVAKVGSEKDARCQ